MKGERLEVIRAEPAAKTAPDVPGLFRTKELKWADGSGTFKGLQVAIVSEDPVTGNKAMFLKLPPNKVADPRLEYHYHTATTHTFVVQGAVASIVNGKRFTVHAGDYFRAPAGWVHGDSHGDPAADKGDPEPTILFMLIEGQHHGQLVGHFETVLVE